MIVSLTILVLGFLSDDATRSIWWWAATFILTILSLVINYLIERLDLRNESNISQNYKTFVDFFTAFNENISRREYIDIKEICDNIINEVWSSVFDNDCRVSYYTLAVEEVHGEILKAEAFNRRGNRGHLSYKIQDKDRLKDIFENMKKGNIVVYDDIRLKGHSSDMEKMNIDPFNNEYVSFIRIPIGYSESKEMAVGVLVADSKESCYFSEGNSNYNFATHVADMIKYTHANSNVSLDDSIVEMVQKEVLK